MVWDTALPGFGIRVFTGWREDFILQSRVNGKLVKRTIGRFGTMTAEQARKDAHRDGRGDGRRRRPRKERRRAAAREVTLQKAVDAYLRDRDLKPRTVKDVHSR